MTLKEMLKFTQPPLPVIQTLMCAAPSECGYGAVTMKSALFRILPLLLAKCHIRYLSVLIIFRRHGCELVCGMIGESLTSLLFLYWTLR